MKKYTQCRLIRQNENSKTVLVSWIPAKFAIKGNILKLKKNDVWIDGYIVDSVYSSEALDISDSQCIKRHKKYTGDSLPKNERKK